MLAKTPVIETRVQDLLWFENSKTKFRSLGYDNKRSRNSDDSSPPPKKKPKKENKHKASTVEKEQPQTYIKDDEEGVKELHVTLSPVTDTIDPPEPEELIKALMVNLLKVLNSIRCRFFTIICDTPRH